MSLTVPASPAGHEANGKSGAGRGRREKPSAGGGATGRASPGPVEPVTARGAARLVVVMALTVVAAQPVLVGFAPGARPAVILAALGVPAVTALVAARARRLPVFARAAFVAGALLAALLVTLRPGVAILSGPQRFLTAARPVAPAGAELASVVVVVGLAGLAAAELALPPRARFAPAVPALVLFGLGLAADGARPAPGWAAAALVVLTALLLAVGPAGPTRGDDGQMPESPRGHRVRHRADHRPDDGRAAWRRRLRDHREGGGRAGGRAATSVAVTAAAAAVAGLVAVGGGWLVDAGDQGGRFDARDLVRAPDADQVEVPLRPMARLFAQRAQHPERELFRIDSANAAARGERIRLVALPVFDDLGWAVADAYRPGGRTLPDGPDTGGPPPLRVEQSVTLLAGADLVAWVPSVGRPVEASTAGLPVDEDSGNLVRTGAAEPGPVRLVGAVAPWVDPAIVRGAVRATPAHPLADDLTHRLMTTCPALAELTSVQGQDDTTFARLTALQKLLSTTGGFGLDPNRPPLVGDGVFSVCQLLRDRKGTVEQYASAFAFAALRLGFDARVVVGFEAGDAARGRVVRSGEITAWPEVRALNIGWMPFSPFPADTRPDHAAPDEPAARQSSLTDAVQDATVDVGRQGPQPGPAGDAPQGSQSSPGRGSGVLTATLTAAGCLLLSFAAVVPAAKSIRRRRRRRAPTAAARVDGAWRETVDRLLESGVAARPALTRHELSVAALARHPRARLGPLDDLRLLADEVAFSGEAVDDAAASRAWDLADSVNRRVGGSLPMRARLVALLDIRPLLRQG